MNITNNEWLETNGLGGFACSTVSGIHTRRYHGLLTAATKPPVGRMLLLSKIEEVVHWNGQAFALSTNQYPGGVIHPRGFELLQDFSCDPMPCFRFALAGGEATVIKRIFMPHGENTVVIEYELPEGATLELRPLIAFRDYHSTTHENTALNPTLDLKRAGMVTMRPYADLPALHIAYTEEGATVEPGGHWYRNFEYATERERGLDFQEDLFQPFTLRFGGQKHIALIATIEANVHDATEAAALRTSEIARREAIRSNAPFDDPFVRQLTAAADQFIVQRSDMKTVIAGYPWFSDWGRDTMIALPGLTLSTRRFDVARQILLAFADSISEGMLPNRFPDAGEEPEYNTVDATLWFFEAARAYAAASGDTDFLRQQILPKLCEIVDWHVRGTRFAIRVDPADGLLHCGEPGVQLTWMDAKIGDWVVTPRHGKPVEIQALWYNALCILAELKPEDRTYAEMAARSRDSFNARFWNEQAGCLYDVISEDSQDSSIRPNQIFAVSLPFSMLPPDRARAVVERVQRDLLTPAGLRSLAPEDSRYRGRYEGGVFERDSAYHQGTVWPWLMGGFITAYLKVHERSDAALRQGEEWLRAFHPQLETAGLGQISEINDGDFPHTPRGCFAQAWSVSELLRAACEVLSHT